MAGSIELSEFISNLRKELDAAAQDGQASNLRFELGIIKLQLSVTVEKAASGGGSVKFWVINANTDAKISSSAVQQLTLELAPHWADRPGVRVEVGGTSRNHER